MEFFDTSLELKFAADQGSVRGYGAVFANRDRGGDRIVAGAFTESIAVRPKLPMLFEHREVVGVWTELREDQKGLYVAGKISDTAQGRDARTLAVDGAITGLSIGYRVAADGADYDHTGRVLKKLDVHEISLTALPMNDLARIASAKSLLARGEIPDTATLELLLQSAGFTRRQVKRFMDKGRAGLGAKYAAGDLLDRFAQRLEK